MVEIRIYLRIINMIMFKINSNAKYTSHISMILNIEWSKSWNLFIQMLALVNK